MNIVNFFCAYDVKMDDYCLLHKDDDIIRNLTVEVEYLRVLCGLNTNDVMTSHINSCATCIQRRYVKFRDEKLLKTFYQRWRIFYRNTREDACMVIQRGIRAYLNQMPTMTSLYLKIFRLQDELSKVKVENQRLRSRVLLSKTYSSEFFNNLYDFAPKPTYRSNSVTRFSFC